RGTALLTAGGTRAEGPARSGVPGGVGRAGATGGRHARGPAVRPRHYPVPGVVSGRVASTPSQHSDASQKLPPKTTNPSSLPATPQRSGPTGSVNVCPSSAPASTAPSAPPRLPTVFIAPPSVPAQRSPMSAQQAHAGPIARSLQKKVSESSAASSQTLS